MLIGFLSMAAPAAAQTGPAAEPSRAELEKAYEAAFQEVLKDPGNLDKSFRYAQLAIRLGDFEGAISALERMLILNPDLARVRLELGVLYFRLGSYALAQAYLETAVAGENVPDTVRQRVAVFLDEIEKRTSRHRLTGSLTAGARYQSNANAGPSSTVISLFGILRDALPEEATQQGDVNLFGALSLRHDYDFQTQDGTALQTDVLLFGSKQIEQEQVDVMFAEVSVGPRLRLSTGWLGGLGVRPYLRTSGVYLDDELLNHTFGGGLELTQQLARWLGVTARYDLEIKRFNDTGDRPRASDENGPEHEGTLFAVVALDPMFSLLTRVRIREHIAKVGSDSNRLIGGLLGIAASYEPPVGKPVRRWTTSLSVEYARTDYADPDPAVSPTIKRSDERVDWRLRTSVPITRRFALAVSGTVTEVTSSLVNFEFDNLAASISGTYSF